MFELKYLLRIINFMILNWRGSIGKLGNYGLDEVYLFGFLVRLMEVSFGGYFVF